MYYHQQEYIRMPNAAANLATFAGHHNCSIVLLMGMKVIGDVPQRDLAVVQLNGDHPEVFAQIIGELEASADLEVHEVQAIDFLDGRFYQQRNVKGSRKQVLPLVQAIVDRLEANN